MAIPRQTTETLTDGTHQSRVSKGSYYQNVYVSQGGWEVRRGFGQLGQWDSSMSSPNQTEDYSASHGYAEVMGSYIIHTNFGHDQILTVLRQVLAYTSDNTAATNGQFLPLWSVSIYDVTVDKRWEEVLHLHTRNQSGSPLPAPYWIPHYATAKDKDQSQWLSARESDADPFFQEYLDTVIFGSPALGLWVYRPTDFDHLTPGHGMTDGTHTSVSGQYPYRGESSFVYPLTPANGQFTDASPYFGNDAFPTSPVDCTVATGRTILAQGREVYFADTGRPGCVSALNVLTVQSDQVITAISEVSGNLLIWTANQTWLYRIPASYVAAGGELTLLDNAIGCLGPLAHVKVKGSVVWASARGIHTLSGYNVVPAAEAIESLFIQGVSNPLTSYFVDTGNTYLTDPQPRTFYDWDQINRVSMSYDAKTDSLFVSVPDQECAWVYSQGSWAIWNFESQANYQTPVKVAGLRNLPRTQLITYDGAVYGVHGVEDYPAADATVFFGITPQDYSSPSGSYFITQWGRGGSSDRSMDVREDNRVVCGVYNTAWPGDYFMELGKPFRAPAGYTLPQGSLCTQDTFLFPLYIVPEATMAAMPDHIDLIFFFDRNRWLPLVVGATPELDFIVPPERIQSIHGWGFGAPLAGTAEVQNYDSGAGVPSYGGDSIRIRFDGAHGAAIQTWVTQPTINTPANERSLLMYLPFEMSGALTGDTMSLGITADVADHFDGANQHSIGLVYWCEPYLISKHEEDAKIQPIDWAIKSDPIMPPDKERQVRTRGLWVEALSHGREVTDSIYGQLNFLASADWKDWVSQIVDYTGVVGSTTEALPTVDKEVTDDLGNTNTVRSRFRSSTGAMTPKVLNGSMQWGDQANPSVGTYLVDDEQVDTFAVSDNVKGEHVGWMAFGHLRGRAERLVLKSMRAILDTAGFPRRWGR